MSHAPFQEHESQQSGTERCQVCGGPYADGRYPIVNCRHTSASGCVAFLAGELSRIKDSLRPVKEEGGKPSPAVPVGHLAGLKGGDRVRIDLSGPLEDLTKAGFWGVHPGKRFARGSVESNLRWVAVDQMEYESHYPGLGLVGPRLRVPIKGNEHRIRKVSDRENEAPPWVSDEGKCRSAIARALNAWPSAARMKVILEDAMKGESAAPHVAAPGPHAVYSPEEGKTYVAG